MIVKINITYNEFLQIKANRYDYKYIKRFTAKKLQIDYEAINHVDFSYTRTYNAYLDGDLKDLQENHRLLKEENHYKRLEKEA